MNRYTIAQFNEDFPDDDACLDVIFLNRYGWLKECPHCKQETKFYKLKRRKVYSCMRCGHQLHPLAGTIFHKSATSLKSWFFAIFLFSNSKNGVSAKELERHLGVTYKTAWRMAHQIRKLMEQNADKLDGIVEADETFVGGKVKGRKNLYSNKTAVLGATERKGKARAFVGEANATEARDFIQETLADSAELHTDESAIYTKVGKNYTHHIINHLRQEYVVGTTHTNSIEGFWSQLKRSIDGHLHDRESEHRSEQTKYSQ